ncbi:hypothetical protein GPECTOR_3g11 [Gonium pectorale]|uniref:Serine/threonine-protein kinase ATR n=1 Tax=Gonium pectorale TaxID=33097 RepID=A0A150H041_GONPE|nr:hypothetical protein GPECTOR_3g11 [Gonium pectorale]|eukprot:KXZ54940.1 hypothetical protein GPECTOR_3g11 [Gonium pectorale]
MFPPILSSSPSAASSPDSRRLLARLKLCLARWSWSAGRGGVAPAELKRLFEEALHADRAWDKPHFHYARYLDQIYQDARKRQTAPGGKAGAGAAGGKSAGDRFGGRAKVSTGDDTPYFEVLPDVLRHYGEAISKGHKHVLQTPPRLRTSRELRSATAVTNTMKELAGAGGGAGAGSGSGCGAISAPKWLLALPQLISRIAHTNPEVFDVIRTALVRLTEAFPQQVLWSAAAVCRSNVPRRRELANDVMRTLVMDHFSGLADQLIKLCHHSPAAGRGGRPATEMSVHRDFPQLVMVPTQEQFRAPLPPAALGGSRALQDHPGGGGGGGGGLAKIAGVVDRAVKPKKITFLDSDGNEYPFLAKPKDDLRKDYRLMDFASMLNALFGGDAASRRRGLRLRTYAVVALTEDCGILQWVNGLTALKGAIEDTYTAERLINRRRGGAGGVEAGAGGREGGGGRRTCCSMSERWRVKTEFVAWIRKLWDSWTEPTNKAKLLGKVLERLPPRLHRWLLTKHPEPAAWLAARTNFTRTNAVWCMVGHMLGLGDRHGENILLDCAAGDTVQVDFGCLFDRGLTLEVPEMVPFRLTQNVVDGFGISGVEGVFRRCAETTLQVLRQHRDTLMTVAETFLYDPLVEWASHKPAAQQAARGGAAVQDVGGEVENPAAKDALSTIEGRLGGTLLGVQAVPTLPLSAEGQAARLIAEATDKENLARMYVWWMAWY